MDPSFSYLGGLVVGGRDCKTHQVRNTFWSWDVEKVHAVGARRTFGSQECKKLTGTEHFWTFRYRFVWQAQGIAHLVKHEQDVRVCCSFNYNHHYYIPVHYIKLHYNYNYNYITLRYATLITLHYATLHSITLHYTTRHHTTLTTLITLTLH